MLDPPQFTLLELLNPILIGMGVSVLCTIAVSKLVSGKKHVAPTPGAATGAGAVTDASEPSVDDSQLLWAPVDQRRTVRRVGNPTDVLVATPENKQQPRRGWVSERSLGGLHLHLSDEVKPGTLLSVLPANAPGWTPWVDIEVRSCRSSGEVWEAGCRFVKSPPFTVLMMFG